MEIIDQLKFISCDYIVKFKGRYYICKDSAQVGETTTVLQKVGKSRAFIKGEVTGHIRQGAFSFINTVTKQPLLISTNAQHQRHSLFLVIKLKKYKHDTTI